MKNWELLKLLHEGKTLQKIYHNDPECTKICKMEFFERTCTCCLPKTTYQYNFYGWGSYGLSKEHLQDLLENTEGWEIKI